MGSRDRAASQVRPVDGGGALGREVWIPALVVVVGMIMAILDTTIVNVALDTLGRDLDTPLTSVQWVTTGYLLAMAVVVPATGWAVDRFGAKSVWMVSIALFVCGSALSGAAWNITSLIVFRILQGLGGGMLQPVGQTILARAAGPDRMGRVMSVIGVPMLLGPVFGPVLGGWLVQDVGWRWIFYVNVPIGVIALLLAARLLPRTDAYRTTGRLDTVGMALLSTGLALVVYGLSTAGTNGSFTNATTVGWTGGGLVLVAVFCLYSLGKGPSAVIDVRLFANRVFSAAAVTGFLVSVGLFGGMLLLPLYYQVVRGEGALTAGLLLAPQGLGAAAAMPVAGRLTDKIGAGRVVPVGLLLALLGTFAYTQVGTDTSYWLLAIALFVRGMGLGSTMMPTVAAAYATLSRAVVPRATSTYTITRQIGGSFGTALLAVVLSQQIAAELPASATSSTSNIGAIPSAVREHAAPALANAFGQTFWVAFGLTAAALVPAAFLPRKHARK